MKLSLVACLFLLAFTARVGAEVTILVVYYSPGGHTKNMAEAVAAGARSVEDANVMLREVSEAKIEEVVAADAIILGSPVYNANVAPAMQSFINSWPFEKGDMRNKIGAAFCTGGGISAGEETTQLAILRSMLTFGMVVVGGPMWTQAFGASAVTEEMPFRSLSTRGDVAPQFLAKGEALGRRVAEITLLFNPSGKDVSASEGTTGQ